MQILKKISIKTVCNLPKAFFKALPEGETPLMRIMGLARKCEVGTSTYGDFLAFKGEFQAINLQDGTVSIGPTAFLPSPVDALLKAQIDEFGQDGKAPVEFAFDIMAIPDANSEVGFQYRVKSVTETKTSDPLAALAARISGVALPAPKADQTAGEQAPVQQADVKAADGAQLSQHADTQETSSTRGRKKA